MLNFNYFYILIFLFDLFYRLIYIRIPSFIYEIIILFIHSIYETNNK